MAMDKIKIHAVDDNPDNLIQARADLFYAEN